MKTPSKSAAGVPSIKPIASNRKARHLYHILETHEAGLVLEGPEVKSLRAGRANLIESYGHFEKGELYLLGMHIAPYDPANRWNPEPTRPRKLLLHRSELKRLWGKAAQRGLTLVPLSLYFKGSRVKVELAVAQGKKLHDRREAIKQRDQEREMQREMRHARQ